MDAQGDAGGGWLLPPPRLLGSRGQAEVGSREPHVGLSGRDAASPGTSMGRCRSRLGSRCGSHGKRGPAVPQLASVSLQRVFSGRAASGSSLGPGPQGHGQRAAGHRAGQRRSLPPEASWGSGATFLPFLWLVPFPAGSGQASGRLRCHPWVPGGQLCQGPHHSCGCFQRPPWLSLSSAASSLQNAPSEHPCFRWPAGGGPGGVTGHWALPVFTGHCQVLSAMGWAECWASQAALVPP